MKRFVLYVILALMFAGSHAGAERLTTEAIDNPEDIAGVFTVYLYGGTYFNDPEAAVLFDLQGDDYRIEPRAPSFEFEVLKGLSAEEAFQEGRAHLGAHTEFLAVVMRAIKTRGGQTVGYEFLPRYRALRYGVSDVVDTYYRVDGDKTVHAFIRLDPLLEDQLLFSGDNAGGYSP